MKRKNFMSIDLNVPSPISVTPQTVSDQNNNPSALSLGSQSVGITGADVVGGPMPLVLTGNTTAAQYQGGTTWGRLIRLQDHGTSGRFFDIGIDQNGNLFVNSGSSTETKHILTLTPDGALLLTHNT
jgi:hypothetical protein